MLSFPLDFQVYYINIKQIIQFLISECSVKKKVVDNIWLTVSSLSALSFLTFAESPSSALASFAGAPETLMVQEFSSDGGMEMSTSYSSIIGHTLNKILCTF